jgi:hypothetical protein
MAARGERLVWHAAHAEVDRLQQICRTGGSNVPAAIHIHNVVLKAHANNEESGRQAPEQIAHEGLVVAILNNDGVGSEAADLLRVAGWVRAEARDREFAIAVQQLRQSLTE